MSRILVEIDANHLMVRYSRGCQPFPWRTKFESRVVCRWRWG